MSDVREKFDEAVEGMRIICKAQIRNVDRIDSLIETYDERKTWELDCSISKCQDCVGEKRKVLETAMEIIDGLRFEDFENEDMEDPVAPFIPDRFAVTDMEEMYDAYNVYRILRPYGERIEQLHRLVIESSENDKDK